MSHLSWSIVLGGVASFVINFWLARRTGRLRAERSADGWRVIDVGTANRAVALFCAVVALVLSLAASRAGESQRFAAAAVATFLVVGAVVLLYVMFLHVVRYNAKEVQMTTPFGARTMRYADVASVRIFRAIGLARLADEHDGAIWVPLIGGARLLSRYGRRLERTQVLDKLLRPFKLIDLMPAPHEALPPDLPETIARIAGLAAPATRMVVVDGDRSWVPENDVLTVLLVVDGEAQLEIGRHLRTMTRGDAVSIPAELAGAIAVHGAEASRAQLMVCAATPL